MLHSRRLCHCPWGVRQVRLVSMSTSSVLGWLFTCWLTVWRLGCRQTFLVIWPVWHVLALEMRSAAWSGSSTQFASTFMNKEPRPVTCAWQMVLGPACRLRFTGDRLLIVLCVMVHLPSRVVARSMLTSRFSLPGASLQEKHFLERDSPVTHFNL
jgi:hypothetical protein